MKQVFLILKLVVVLYALLLAVVYLGERFIVFQPHRLSKDHSFTFDTPFEEHFIETTPGIQINYLYFNAPKPAKGLVFYFHGNADNLDRWGENYDNFVKRGYDVVMPDYRGYGKSGGKVSEKQTYEDIWALYQSIKKTKPPKELIIYGRSLGSGVASDLATKVPAKMLILETPFNSIPSLFQDQLLLIWLPFRFKYQFPNDQNLKKIKYPVYIFHGTADRTVPYRNAERLKEILKEGDAFFTIEGGTHHNLDTQSIYQEKLDWLLGVTK